MAGEIRSEPTAYGRRKSYRLEATETNNETMGMKAKLRSRWWRERKRDTQAAEAVNTQFKPVRSPSKADWITLEARKAA